MPELITDDKETLSREVGHESDTDHREVAKTLSKKLSEIGGLGLSANQIGIFNSRTCIVTAREEIFLVNPRIVNREGETQTTEGCLSFPNQEVRTNRNVWVEVEADAWKVQSVGEWNEIGGRLSFGPDTWAEHMENDEKWKQTQEDYLESIAVQHEIDHLNGKTIFDRQVRRDPFEKNELDNLGRNDKVRVRNSEDEEFDVKWKYASKKIARRNENGPWELLKIKEN